MNLDKHDYKLLAELDKNARQSYSSLGRKVRLHKNTVAYKVKRMEEEGIIKGYFPVINIHKLGYNLVRVYLNFFNATPEVENSLIQKLMSSKEVTVLARLETTYDLMFMCTVKDLFEFYSFWIKIKSEFREYFYEERIHVFYSFEHLNRAYLTDDSTRKKQKISNDKKIIYDDLDIKILNELSKNARMPVIEISKRINILPQTIIKRIKNLEKKGIIIGYRPNIDTNKINYQYHKINLKLSKYNPEIKRLLAENKYVVFFDETISDYDFEFDVEVPNKEELNNILSEIQKQTKVRKIEIINFLNYEKFELVPTK